MYKFSEYNLSVPYKDKVIYNNTLQKSSFILSPGESDRIAQQLKDPITFDLAFPSIFLQFKKWGFVMDDDLDEFTLFRNRTTKQFFESRAYHLTLYCGIEGDIEEYNPSYSALKVECKEGVLELLKRHIDHVAKQWKAEQISLEFTGGEPLLQFESLIEPLCKHTKRVCKDNRMSFQAQIETQGLRLSSYSTRFQMSGINAVRITVEADERRHNKVHHEKGLPTFRRKIEEIVSACKMDNKLCCLLQIKYESNDSDKELQALLDSIPQTHRSRISLLFQNNRAEAVNMLNTHLEEKINDRLNLSGFALGMTQNEGGWRNITIEHHGVRTVLLNGDLYFGQCEMINPIQKIGPLSDKTGEVVADETDEHRAYGLQWFENDLCRKCKILPAVYPICAKVCRLFDGCWSLSVKQKTLHRRIVCRADVRTKKRVYSLHAKQCKYQTLIQCISFVSSLISVNWTLPTAVLPA